MASIISSIDSKYFLIAIILFLVVVISGTFIKKLRDSKKNQKVFELKEIRMQPKIASGDLDFKSKHIKEFLDKGNKVKVTVRFRGRELAHTEIGVDVLNEVLKRLEGEYVMDKAPAMEGRFMSMTLNPKTKK